MTNYDESRGAPEEDIEMKLPFTVDEGLCSTMEERECSHIDCFECAFWSVYAFKLTARKPQGIYENEQRETI